MMIITISSIYTIRTYTTPIDQIQVEERKETTKIKNIPITTTIIILNFIYHHQQITQVGVMYGRKNKRNN